MRRHHFIPAFLSAYLLCLFLGTGCAKEYSYEGSTRDTLPKLTDTNQLSNFALPLCYKCTTSFGTVADTWSLEFNKTTCCGNFTRTVITPTRDGFTFFGPSACSADSGLILNTFFTPIVFDKDLQNVSTTRTAFYYYDNKTAVNAPYILQAKREFPFTVIIDTYNYQSGLAKGRFFGYAFSNTNDTVYVKNGRFSITIPR